MNNCAPVSTLLEILATMVPTPEFVTHAAVSTLLEILAVFLHGPNELYYHVDSFQPFLRF